MPGSDDDVAVQRELCAESAAERNAAIGEPGTNGCANPSESAAERNATAREPNGGSNPSAPTNDCTNPCGAKPMGNAQRS